MTILCDWQIAELISNNEMISPAVLHQVREHNGKPCVSYGLSSAGYDIRLGNMTMHGLTSVIADPTKNNEWISTSAPSGADIPVTIPAGDYMLGVSVERFKIPANVLGVCVGKSTYARLGVIVNVTPLEPEWEGYLTLEIHNASRRPVVVHPGHGIAQIMFHRISEPDVTYADRAGKYQDQPARPVGAKV